MAAGTLSTWGLDVLGWVGRAQHDGQWMPAYIDAESSRVTVLNANGQRIKVNVGIEYLVHRPKQDPKFVFYNARTMDTFPDNAKPLLGLSSKGSASKRTWSSRLMKALLILTKEGNSRFEV